MSKKYTAEQLMESVNSSVDITCSRCRETNAAFQVDEFDACEEFFKMGWRATNSHTYCPSCAKKRLKSHKTKKK